MCVLGDSVKSAAGCHGAELGAFFRPIKVIKSIWEISHFKNENTLADGLSPVEHVQRSV